MKEGLADGRENAFESLKKGCMNDTSYFSEKVEGVSPTAVSPIVLSPVPQGPAVRLMEFSALAGET